MKKKQKLEPKFSQSLTTQDLADLKKLSESKLKQPTQRLSINEKV